MHFERKQFNLEEDPWENYLFHDSKKLVPLFCNNKPLSLSEQVILAKFIEYSVQTESISQYKIVAKDLIKELLDFANSFS